MQIRLHCANLFRRKIFKMNGSFQKVLLSGKSRCYNYNSNRIILFTPRRKELEERAFSYRDTISQNSILIRCS